VLDTFQIQLITSFFVGGAIVAAQSLVAEKCTRDIAGLVVSMPSTIVVNLFFLYQVMPQVEFAKILHVIPAPLGASFLFITVYFLLFRLYEKFLGNQYKLFGIISCILISILTWLLVALPLAIKEVDNFGLSLVIYVLLILVTQFILSKLSVKLGATQVFRYSIGQKIFRIVFSGFIIALTVYLGKVLGPFWGGVMAMFPAAYFSGIIVIHMSNSTNKLIEVFAKSALGSITLIVYAACSHFFFPAIGPYLGTLAAFTLSALCSYLIYKSKLA